MAKGAAVEEERPVARAACLNCRQAKRRCDGVQPMCGPCASRGVEAGACNFVSSRRGGPRFKGVSGADAIRIKAERERQKVEKRVNKLRGKDSPEEEGYEGDPSYQARRSSLAGSHMSGSSSQHGWTASGQHPSVMEQQSSSPYGRMGETPTVLMPIQHNSQTFAQGYNGMPMGAPREQYSSQLPYSQAMPQQAPLQTVPDVSSPFGQPPHVLPSANTFMGFGSDELSFANLELWQHMQNSSIDSELGQFSDFFARLQGLPKAGIIGANECVGDPLDVLMDWEGGQIGGNVQDNEQGVRALLSDFYELVYPACPVLPSPGNLPSLAFYFSGKGPCGLFAALSAVVALHLPNDEPYKTLKASQHPLQRFEGSPPGSSGMSNASVTKTAEDVAAYHAKTSEFILHQWETKKRTCFMDPTADNPFAGMDEELITIEGAAAHTLLCIYYYGTGKPLGHQRAYKHAVEAWNLMQTLEIQPTGDEKMNSTKPFASEIKREWAKRVYWCAYSAATVMSCTGGFAPFGNAKDGLMDVQTRPSLEDPFAWGVMVRGAQQVSRSYRLLYNLDQLRNRVASSPTSMSPSEMQEAMKERQEIFNAMLKLDTEISNYTRFDAGWRDPPPEPGNEGFVSADKELARSLKAAGRLMTSGAIIILHRSQAFSNARVFMEPQCGIPEASRANRHPSQAHPANTIMHRAEMVELPPPRLGETPSISRATSFSGRNGGTGGSDHSGDRHIAMTAPTSVANHGGDGGNGTGSTHPFLTDRFAGGPFEPAHSLDRCRFAASTMVGTLPRILRDGARVPKLPPYSACSYVLGAYSILMLTLLIRVRGEMAVNSNGQLQSGAQRQDDPNAPRTAQELRLQLEMHRAPVRDMLVAMRKFACVWNKAVEYEAEVSLLLSANEVLG